MKSDRAFTLIELLVVVAIVSILAALALVNLQAAQTRAKISRVQADIRSIASAIEVYRTDQGVYPHAAVGDFQLSRPLDQLTTPVAYLSSLPADVFGPAPMDFAPQVRMLGYSYKDARTTSTGMPGESYAHIWRNNPRLLFLLHSCGPNIVWDVAPYREYDPTNGTISPGDITRFGPM